MGAGARRPRVVVVGMGDTGVLVASRLARHADVVGIATAPMFVSGQELGTRLARPGQWRRDYLMEYAAYRRLAGVEVVHGEATGLDLAARTVRVREANGDERELTHDAVVVASGTTNGFWRSARVRSRGEVEEALAAGAAAVASARSVAVVGGGPSGVSVASNVADARPDVDVALYHGGDRPLPGYHDRVRTRVVARLDAQGVRRHPGHRAVVPDEVARLPGPGTVTFTTGQPPVTADVVVWAVGHVRPNTGFLPAELLDDDGFVRVDATLRVPGHPGVFAIGDVAATDPRRSSARNFGHRVVAHNVRAVLDGRPDALREFRPPRHRWGSVLGLQHDGIRIFTPRGGVVRLSPAFARHVLYPWLTHRLLYGGLTRHPRRRPPVPPAA